MELVAAVLLSHDSKPEWDIKTAECPGCGEKHLVIETPQIGFIGSADEIIEFAESLKATAGVAMQVVGIQEEINEL